MSKPPLWNEMCLSKKKTCSFFYVFLILTYFSHLLFKSAFNRSEIGWHAIILVSDVEQDQSGEHKNNSSDHKKGIDDQKYCVDHGDSSVNGLRKQEIEYSLAKEDDHQADADGRPVEILLCVDHVYRIKSDQWVEQPRNTDPNEYNKCNPCDFFRIHCFISYKK
jgi:hypothetical protein